MLYVSDVVTENGPVSHFWGLVFLCKLYLRLLSYMDCHLDFVLVSCVIVLVLIIFPSSTALYT